MPYVGREKLLDKSCNSIYKLVILSAKRALEIAEGQPKFVAMPAATKPSTVALNEIAEGFIQCKKIKTKE